MRYRKDIRLKDYDYRTDGYYFVTICCSSRAKLCLKYKNIIEKHLTLLERNKGVKLDYYNLTANHLHLILVLEEAKLPLYRYIQDFKSKTTLEIKKTGFNGKRFWQPNYYEHVIRNEHALFKIRKYIQENPLKEKIELEKIYGKDIVEKNIVAAERSSANSNANALQLHHCGKFRCFVFLAILAKLTLCSYIHAAFEEREVSARTLGLSGVSAGLADDIDSVFYNPAGLVNLGGLKFNASDANLYDILNYRSFCFGMQMPRADKLGTFGLAYEEFGFKDQYKETKFYFSHGFPVLKNLSVGYSIKSYGLKILYDENEKKYTEKVLTSFDIAGLLSPSEKLSFGLAFYNINSPKIIEDENVPMTYKIGAGYKLSEHFNFGLDFEKENIWHAGIEIKPNNILVFRSGANFNPLKFSFGIGLNFWKISFDYSVSYHPQLEFQKIATFSFAHKFGPTKEKPEKEKKISIPVEEEIQPAEVEEEEKPQEKPVEKKPEEKPELKVPLEIPPEKTPETPVEIQPLKQEPAKPVIPEKKEIEVPAGPKININKADEEELKTLGISESVIKNIIRYRKYKGEFKNIDELRKVPGITGKIFESIKDRVTIE